MRRTLILALLVCTGLPATLGRAQDAVPDPSTPDPATDAPATDPATTEPADPAGVLSGASTDPAIPDEWIDLNLPDELELQALVDAVSGYLKVNILFDDQLRDKRVTIRTPSRITRQGLLSLLDSALQMKQMAIVEAGPGLLKVVTLSNNLSSYATSTQPTTAPVGAVTRVFNLDHADATKVAEVIRPFLNQQAGGNALPLLGTRQLVVSDFAATVDRIESIIRWIDKGDPNIVTRLIPLKRATAADLIETVRQALRDNDKARYGGTGESISVADDGRTNQLLVIGPRTIVADAEQIIADLDKPLDVQTRVYRLQTVSADQVRSLFMDLRGKDTDPNAFRAGVSPETGALVVTATPDVHDQLAELIKQLDSPAQESPIRFYKLKNTIAADILETIAGLTEQTEGFSVSGSRVETASGGSAGGPAGQAGGEPGVNTAPTIAPGEAVSAIQPISQPPVATVEVQGRRDRLTTGAVPSREIENPNISFQYGQPMLSRRMERERQSVQAVRGGGVIVTADVNTNSIIVVAPPQLQRVYADLVKQLDRRRPQVQIECTIVSLDTSNGFVFGVEIGGVGGVGDDGKILSFTSFGLSNVDDGQLSPIGGKGLNFALLAPDAASVVMRALATNGRARTVSMPSVLVNDNETGSLQSSNKVPFVELVDRDDGTTSQTVGGAVEAGTMVTVTPHISENDYLQLDYEIELSSFSGPAEPGLPPPTLVNRVGSTVTIPDAYTIVVGGLSVKNLSESIQGIPFLKDIPWLRLLFSAQTKDGTETTLFVFIRPSILRDEQFRDLRYYSAKAREESELPGDFPESQPLPMR